MMKNELESRLGYTLENWQYQIAEYVYMNSSEIKDVGGKDQIAHIVATSGFEYDSKIWQMYKALNGKMDIIKYSREDFYTTYDVTIQGYCINIQPKKMSQIFREVKEQFKANYTDLHDNADYFTLDSDYRNSQSKPDLFPINTRLAIFYVRGGSEGYYVHVESINDGHIHNLILAKTLLEGENGIQWAEKTVCALSRIMNV